MMPMSFLNFAFEVCFFCFSGLEKRGDFSKKWREIEEKRGNEVRGAFGARGRRARIVEPSVDGEVRRSDLGAR